ncbi:N-acetyltransferase family protein [Sphingopyxis sp.]|uniref:GNAT family N-acetyltransferase n=1 Tax=Sphingopyxis sp. TaxID=1908224 RepID=UPI003D6D2521
MLIRPATPEDAATIWTIIEPVIRAGETLTLDREMGEAAALAYWFDTDKEAFVAEEGGAILGTHYLRANQTGGGAHVANAGYVTGAATTGRGVARAMGLHSIEHAKARGFRAMQFNFVVSTNARAVGLWQSLGFEIVGRLPGAFDHPVEGFVDALVMFRTL